MRSLKKILAVICVVAMLASIAIVPALAATSYDTQAATLNSLGLMTNAGLDQPSNRLQGLIFAIDAAGKQAEALAMSDADVAAALANVVDAKDIPAWGQKFAAYAVKNAFTTGVGGVALPQIKFAPLAPIHATEYLVWLLKIGMGYTNGTSDILTAAVTNNIITISQASKFGADNYTLVRDDIAGMLYTAVSTGKMPDGKTKFIDALIANGAVTKDAAVAAGLSTPAAPAALAATATVLNLKQIQVSFSKEVNKDDAQDVTFYSVTKGSTTYTVSKAAISADNKTVTLTIGNDVTGKLDNNTTATVKVKKDFRDAAGTKLAADISNDVAVGDTTFPTVQKVEAQGLKLLRIYFSEPVKTPTSADFTIKSGSYTWSIIGITNNVNDNYVDLRLGTNLIEGNVDVTIKNSVKDWADLIVFEKTFNYAFAKVTTAPTATITKVEPTAITVTFDRPVYGDFIVSHSIAKYSTYASVTTLSETAATQEIKFNFTNTIPSGNITIFVNPQTDKDIKDLYGNKYVAQSFASTLVADTTGPVVSKQEVSTNASFAVTFDENVVLTTPTNTNYLLTKVSDGTPVTCIPTVSGKVLTITPASAFKDNTQYQLVIKSIKDASNNESKDITLTFTTGDNSNPSITSDTFAVDSDGKIYLYFSEPMNATEMLKKSNYLVATNSGLAVWNALGDDDTVTAVSDSCVLIDMKSATNAPSVKVSANVTDLSGNKLDPTNLQVSKNAIGAETFTLDKAEQIAKNKIKLTFNRAIGEFNSANLSVSGIDNVTSVAISAVESVSGKEVVVNLDTDLTTDAKIGAQNVSVTAITTSGIKTIYGTTLTANTTMRIADKCAPEVTKDSNGNYNVFATLGGTVTDSAVTVTKGGILTIHVNYSENITGGSISMLTYTVAGYTLLGYTVAGSDVQLTVKADDNFTVWNPAVTQVYNIKDVNDNVFAGGVTWSSIHN